MREKINYVIHVNNLTYDTEDTDLKQFFKLNRIDKVKDILIAKDEDGKSRGFAFVEFDNEEDLNKSLKIESKKIKGRHVVIKLSKRNIGKITHDEANVGEKKKDEDRVNEKEYVGKKRKVVLELERSSDKDRKDDKG